MSHEAFQSMPLEAEADFVVVGSGAGGASAAVTLARGGASVLLVEAGAWRDPHDYPTSVYGSMRDLFDDWGSTITRGRAFWPVVQASAVGGTTVINSAICVRTPADIFTQWARDHGVGGKAMAESVWGLQEKIEAELHVMPTAPEFMGAHNDLAAKGASKLGHSGHSTQRYAKDCIGSGQCMSGCRAGRKQSLNTNFVPELLRLGGTVVSCAPVAKVVWNGRRAVGVTGHFRHPSTRRWGGRFTLRARKAVVMAASATHSPVLLLRSGLRNRHLGRHFRAHPGTGIFGCYDDPVDLHVGATQGWASSAFRDTPGFKIETLSLSSEMIAGRLQGGGTQLVERLADYRHLAMWVMAVRAETEGRIRRGLGGKPVVHYTLDKPDMIRLRTAAGHLARMHFAAGAKAVIPGIYGIPYAVGPGEVSAIDEAPLDPRRWFAVLSHLFGGCVMGRDPTRSVCDEEGRVHDVDGLVVADASVIPTNLGVNPQHTIMGLAQHFSKRMLARA